MADSQKTIADAISEAVPEEQIKFQQQVQQAEMDSMNNQVKLLNEACNIKCLDTSFRNLKLYKGEVACLDKCTAKYLEFNAAFQKGMNEFVEEKQEMFMKEMAMQEEYIQGKEGVAQSLTDLLPKFS